ncbi:GNAT family N-acetyltransferase [Kitasatospora aureofaciens]|uniref:GNAT family N-acetyltransferase n=1 Tax=Kitasatospora aureofaciens TaxID=1894 RepID=UPI0036F48A98
MNTLSVSPLVRGQRLGHRLIKQACAHYRGLGYRLALGTFTTSTLHLVSYYQQSAWRSSSAAVARRPYPCRRRPVRPSCDQRYAAFDWSEG